MEKITNNKSDTNDEVNISRFGVKLNPPSILLEFTKVSTNRKYLKKIKLHNIGSSVRASALLLNTITSI